MDSIKRLQKLLPNRPLSGRYSVIRLLGAGGFGQTFLAKDTQLPGQPLCVVKQLKPQVKNGARWDLAKRLFDTEAAVLYQLGNHDQIPRLLAHFEDNQEFYLVQEYIEGEALDKMLLPNQPWAEAQVIRWLQDLLSILVFVHRQHVIHRDIKPSNLMRRRLDDRLVLIDFGAVKQVSASLANSLSEQTMTISIGTQGYMPSEQISGNPRFNSDLYAVGIIGIQAVTGIRPSRLQRDLQTGEVLWRNAVPSIHPEFADILDRMVRYHFIDRYQTVEEPLQAIEALLARCPEHFLLAEAVEVTELNGSTVFWESNLASSESPTSSSLPSSPTLADATPAPTPAKTPARHTPPNSAPSHPIPPAAASASPILPTAFSELAASDLPDAALNDLPTEANSAASPAPPVNLPETVLEAPATHVTSRLWTTIGSRFSPWMLLLAVGAVIASAVVLSHSTNVRVQSKVPSLPNLPCRELPPPALPSTKPSYEYADGTRYYGLIEDERPADGRAIMVFSNGNRYDGEFKDGRRNGCGTYSFTNGKRYIGQFKADQFDGLGIWLLGDGNRYVGAFKDNRCHGEGIFLLKDGTSKQGTWQNGEMVNGTLSCNR